MSLTKTNLVVIWLLFIVHFIEYSYSQPISISICGDGIVDIFDEECDSTEHCTNCYCDKGYMSVNSLCVPKCDIEGCINGCISPNECSTCQQPAYQWDCHSCGDGYYMEGFMKCILLNRSELYTCDKMLKDNSLMTIKDIQLSSLLLNNVREYTLYLKDFKLTIDHCYLTFDPSSPYVKGIWIELDVIDEGYYVIETEREYTTPIIEYITVQQNSYGFDSIITIEKECFTINSTGTASCEGNNNDINDYILSASLMKYFTVGKYYLHVFGNYGVVPTEDLKLYVRKINHPCSSRFTQLFWNDIISSNYTTMVSTVDSIYSTSSCSTQLEKGKWFFIKGSDKTIKISTCNNSQDLDSFIHLVQVSKTNDDFTNVRCDEKGSICLEYSDRGCGINSRLIHQLSSDYDYFIFVSSTKRSLFQVEFSTTCPYDCLNGVCSVSKGGCVCNEGYAEKDGVCTKCGNGIVDVGEECDPSNNITKEYYCSEETCMCSFGYVPVTINGITKCAISTCGNEQIDEYEECDGGNGCDHCHCINGYTPYAQARLNCLLPSCGNGRIDSGEECDGGDGCIECECQPGWYSNGHTECKKYSEGGLLLMVCIPGIIVYELMLIILLIIFLIQYHILNDKIIFEQKESSHLFYDLIIPYDKTYCYPITLRNEYFNIQPQHIDFISEDICPEVDQIAKRECIVTNFSNETMNFIFHGKQEPKYEIIFVPCRGIVKSNDSVTVQIQICVHCTTTIHESIKVTVGFSHFKRVFKEYLSHQHISTSKSDKSNKSQRSGRSSVSSLSNQNSTSSEEVITNLNKAKQFSVELSLDARSKLSTKLDEDEIHTFQPPIGEGTFGVVFKGEWRKIDVAVKCVKTDFDSIDDLIPSILEEVKLLEQLRSPCIISFIGYCITKESICLVMEYCPLGSLKKYLQSNPSTNFLKLRFCQDIARGMLYLHENDIIHRDLKPDNVLVISSNPNDEVVCKVTDFGTSKILIDKSGLGKDIKDIGTPMYMAPEIHTLGVLNKKVDVFSYAICLLEIWLGRSPYNPVKFPDAESILSFVSSGQRLEIPQNCPYKKIIKSCWRNRSSKRPSFNEIEKELTVILYSEKDKKTFNTQQTTENNLFQDTTAFRTMVQIQGIESEVIEDLRSKTIM
ncbi:protein kinase domain containing protein [Entamoeba histolytica HM-1:IMSS-B]|uniref:Protein kinase domain containing protein n=6 Tax=Entamoeba histolytica TaxID=5759 RepID=C4M1S0_ENTH1|nr:protein kinase domain containing protein [Entamoeba histolytica HM-1:IMSS]EMD44552.1 serine/threonine protein kinase, putative [Entamoeba histolytica KU27]EMH76077.1 protein kinase domain containing protein [Entamoeba histolytica HM-1:IMSS-B]EMS13319.1 serine-threonine protein kinase, putative [Entamoeba histolytica HM-3:IMSS]ENY63137.1 serine-threonine protein kinase, putative [Entamoeba histolytica HM-1:IMSS-A]GAT95181.1 protein kinase domain containing protein [Entamoeba histolytica]|eukprot:XP_648676.1 protein kinase domain containing protein [Entamoeba histolytica HM-1:IMSS]